MKIYKLNGREIHLVGDTVAVAWNLSYKTEKFVASDGSVVETTAPARSGAPYIDFVSIREIRGGEIREDEDSPVVGGISAEYAVTVANELLAAVDYLRRVE